MILNTLIKLILIEWFNGYYWVLRINFTTTLSCLACLFIFYDVAPNARLSCCTYICYFSFYGSNMFVTSPPPSPFTVNRTNNFWNEQNRNIERKFPSFEPLGIFKVVVISSIFILLFMIFLHLCITVRYVTFTTNLTLPRKNKIILTLTQSLMTPLLALSSLLLFGLLSAESPEHYLPLIFILPKLEYGHMFTLALKFRKTLF